MKAFLHDSTMHWKTKINYKSQAKYIVICPGSALAGSCLVGEWNITTTQINPPKAGYYPHSHNFQLVQNTGRGYSFPLPKDTGYTHFEWHSFLYTGHEYWKKNQKNVNWFFIHQLLHLKIYVQKMYYSSTMPSRKQSHYRYQNENLHLSHFGHMFLTPNPQSKPGTHNKAPILFFLQCQSWVVSLQLIRAGTTTGNKVLGLELPYQLDPLKSRSSSTVCERNFVTNMGFGLLCSVKHRTSSVPSWKLLLGISQCNLYRVTLSTEKLCHLRGFNLKADLPVFYIYLILIWKYNDSYCSLSNF